VSAALSLCMIVRNEEVMLPQCLASVADLVDDIVIVDTGSADTTRQIARDHGATVLDFDFARVDFAGARNHGLGHARGAFILVLDADEVVDPASWPHIHAHVMDGQDVGYIATRRNHPHESPTSVRLDHAVRLFPNRPCYRYRRRVHETIDDSILAGGGRLRRSAIMLDHFLPAVESQRAKGKRYLDLLLQDVAEEPNETDRLVFLAAEYHQLEMFDEATAVAERIAQLCPQDFRAQLNAGLYHAVHQRDLDRARIDLAAALRLRPDDPEAHALREAIDDGLR